MSDIFIRRLRVPLYQLRASKIAQVSSCRISVIVAIFKQLINILEFIDRLLKVLKISRSAHLRWVEINSDVIKIFDFSGLTRLTLKAQFM